MDDAATYGADGATTRPVVLITGAGGRIGSAITAALGGDYTIVGLERRCDGDPNCIPVDLTNQAQLEQALDEVRRRFGNRIASVIHLAAYFDFSGKPDPKYQTVNVEGTRHLLEALQAFEVEQFVYASTMLVHRPSEPGRPIDEDVPLEPKWAYPESKVAAESEVRRHRGDIPFVILRLAGVYTDQCSLPGLASQIQRIYERQWLSHLFPGDSTHGQSAVHIDDVADLFARTVARRQRLPPETTLLVGEPQVESYAELQNRIGRLIHGQGWVTHEIPKSVAASGAWMQDKLETVVPDSLDYGIEPFIRPFMAQLADDHYELDIGRAQRLLDWRPRHRLADELTAMIEQLKRDPVTWYQANRIPLPPRLDDARGLGPAGKVMDEFEARQRKAHLKTLWAHYTNAALGLWLMSSPFALGLAQYWMEATALITPNQRGLAYSHTFMTASDLLTGALIVLFSLLALSRDKPWARWIVAALGVWLLFAPLAFWTPSAAAYANDTLVGALVIVLAIAVPPAPGISLAGSMRKANVPPGWDYNPSGWTQRIPIIFLAFVGLFISRYLAAFQLGHIENAWDPFFGDGTERIITSYVSEAWPVADAGLGATTYAMEIVTGAIGDRRRWRTMPWLVLLFGFMIVPLGGTSLFFIIIQPVWLGTWCTLCLVAAAAMLIQIPYSFDEILATVQFLRERRRKGRPLLRVFLLGDDSEADNVDSSDDFERPARHVVREMVTGGVNVPWNLALSIAIGLVLMFSRPLFGAEGGAADSDHVIGALVISFAVAATAEVARPLRFANALLGAWLLLAPWLLGGFNPAATAADLIAGIALIALSIPRGRIICRYAGWDRWLR